jgi:hypothetical protein
MKKAKSGFATLKRKATAVLSPKKKRTRIPEDAETQVMTVMLTYLHDISILTLNSQVLAKAGSKTVNPKPTVIDVDDDDDEMESAGEDEEAELSKSIIDYCIRKSYLKLERMMKRWTSPVYAFYQAIPNIEYIDGRRGHVFKCAAKSCTYKCRRFLDGPDRSSTGNLIKHVKSCWGDTAYQAAVDCQHANDARKSVVKPLMTTGTITAAFDRKGKGKVSYRHRQYTKTETK